jgi:hypothetical protein
VFVNVSAWLKETTADYLHQFNQTLANLLVVRIALKKRSESLQQVNVGIGAFARTCGRIGLIQPPAVVSLIVPSETLVMKASIQSLKEVEGHPSSLTIVENERICRKAIDGKTLCVDLALLASDLVRAGQKVEHEESFASPKPFLQKLITRVSKGARLPSPQTMLVGEAVGEKVSGLLSQALVATDFSRGTERAATVENDRFKTTIQKSVGSTQWIMSVLKPRLKALVGERSHSAPQGS